MIIDKEQALAAEEFCYQSVISQPAPDNGKTIAV